MLAQLDTTHHLQPFMLSDYVDLSEEFVYLSTPSKTAVNVKITYPDGIKVPYFIVKGSTNVITNGELTIKNDTPARISFTDASGTILKPGNSPITLQFTKAGSTILANEGGLLFKSSKEIFVNYRARSNGQAGSVLTKGKAAYGKNFLWGGSPITLVTTIKYMGNAVTITALDDDTIVDLSNLKLGIYFQNINNGEPLTTTSLRRTLQKGESYIFYAPVKLSAASPQDSGWLGSSINSNKNIIVTVGGLMQQGGTANVRDVGIDQIVPIESLGKEYVIMQGNGGNYEKVIVVATQPDTKIYTNNNTTTYASIANTGGFVEIPASEFKNTTMYVTSTKPIYVYHKVFGGDVPQTNNLTFIPPISCFGQNEVDLIPNSKTIGGTSYGNTKLNVLSRSGDASKPTVTLNGTTLQPSTTSTITGNTNWKAYSYALGSLADGNIKISSTTTIQAVLMGASGDAGFGGYYSGFGLNPNIAIEVVDNNNPLATQPCTGNSGNSQLRPSITFPNATYQWYKNNTLIPGATNFMYSIPTTDIDVANYTVNVTLADGCTLYAETLTSYKCACLAPGTIGTPNPSVFGISTTENHSSQNWPKDIPNGLLVMESTNKGFVITRLPDPEFRIEQPVAGMIVYDTDDKCLKLYDGQKWACVKQTCY